MKDWQGLVVKASNALVHCNHVGQDVEDGLGDCLVVYLHQVHRLMVDFYAFVEPGRRLDLVSALLLSAHTRN